MKKTLAVLTLAFMLALTACHKDPGTVSLKLNPMFGNYNMALKSVYQAPDGKYFKFTMLKMYLSHIKLVRTDNTTVEISPLVYLSSDTASQLSMPVVQAPSGSYKAIQFGIGLDSAQDY